MEVNLEELAQKYKNRRQRLMADINVRFGGSVQGVLVTNPVDIRYLSGLREGCPSLLVGADWVVLFTSIMFKDLVPLRAPGVEMCFFDELDRDVIAEFGKRGVDKIGVQTDQMSVDRYRTLCKYVPEDRLISAPEMVTQGRAVKDAGEIALTRRAIQIAEGAMREMLAEGAAGFIGKTEKQLAAELEYKMRLLGADKQGFQSNGTIVGSGPNSAACHHVPTDRVVEAGDAILFDWGAEIEGYRSDMTRVVFMGSVPPEIAEIYPLLREATRLALAELKPGALAIDVDAAARDFLKEAGYTTEFRHGLGHGVGLLIHEYPRLGLKSTDRLGEGMIVTLEPGVYFNQVGGARLEDDYLITADGSENLCSLPMDLEEWILK